MSLIQKSRRIVALLFVELKVLFRFGPKGIIDDIRNFLQLWSLTPGQHEIADSSTSLSDTDRYNLICRQAVEEQVVFAKFKSSREYREILQHVSRIQGWDYMAQLRKDPWILSKLPDLLDDKLGKPFKYSYGHLGRLSPTDLRYAKVLSDLFCLFGLLDGFSISEIGSGYGGQALAIAKTFRISTYTLFDLTWAAKLARKYIESSTQSLECSIGNFEEISPNCDLLISNYAFSELKLAVQMQYLENVILKSTRGYVIYNHINPANFNSLTAESFAAKIPGAEIFEEIPLTSPANVLVVWGHNRKIENNRFPRR